ncbi:MAG: tRNA lysidine(34) synthetase TilS [Methylococcaceae bacterium]|nr:tRNA lysidine(34) synthetase TilS [Methylococcaceae bacterium]
MSSSRAGAGSLPARFAAGLARFPLPSRYWVAYSGGLDSHVLLHLTAGLASERPDFPEVAAVHVHHGLLPEAERWTRHCARICDELGLSLIILRVDARPNPGESPEEAARTARYTALGELLTDGCGLLTAQHRDDQAETLLLQLLRGAGLAGLAGMRDQGRLGRGRLLRPLLEMGRDELRRYAVDHCLTWVEDPSNEDQRYDRNYLRHSVMPVLKARWPGADRVLSRSAGHCAEARDQLLALSDDLYASLRQADGSLSIDRLRRCSAADQRLLLRRWIAAAGLRMPPARVLQQVIEAAIPACAGRVPQVAWADGLIRRYRNGLYLAAAEPATGFDRFRVIPWRGEEPLVLSDGNGELWIERVGKDGIDPDLWEGSAREVRYRGGGERCRLAGRHGSHSLKNLFQEIGLPPWQRERIPLLYLDGRLAAVVGLWVCEPFAATGPGVQVRWRR